MAHNSKPRRMTAKYIAEILKLKGVKETKTRFGKKALMIDAIPVDAYMKQAHARRLAKRYRNKREMKAMKRARVLEMKRRQQDDSMD